MQHHPFVLSGDPHIFVVEGFIDSGEGRALRDAAAGRLRRSRTTQRSSDHLRTSSSCYLDNSEAASASLRRRVAALLDVEPGRLERTQVCRYLPGERYALHNDALTRPHTTARDGGQRTHTVLIYLNDVTDGGATHFPHLQLSIHPHAGRALVFRPSARGGIDTRLVHEAQPAKTEKWVVQVWVRERAART